MKAPSGGLELGVPAPLSRTSAAFIAFAIVFSVSYASLILTLGHQILAPVWPANAIVLVILLRSRPLKKLRAGIGAGAIAGSILANWLGGHSLGLSVWFTAANCMEVLVAFFLIRRAWEIARAQPHAQELQEFRGVVRAAIVAPAISAIIAACGLTVLVGAHFQEAYLSWFFTAALGLLIVTPIGLRLHLEDLEQLKTPKFWRSAALLVLLTVSVSAFVFGQSKVPALFLLTPVVLFAAYRHRTLGAAAAIALIAAVTVPLTENGYGPFALFKFSSRAAHQFGLQFFFVIQSMISLWLAAILDDRDSLRRALELKERTAREKAAAQTQLLTNVAHEIRTPLNAILGLGEMLQSREHLSKDGQILLETMVGASTELQALANDLLDRSRIERGALRIQAQAIPLTPLFEELRQEIQAFENLPRAELDIQDAGALSIWADPLRAKQILRNLLANAIKYAGAYGPITMRAAANGEMTRIEVTDRGPGIPLIRHREVFEPFSGLGPNEASNVSAGFGLSMVKLLAEAQGGKAGFSSAPHIETRFWVELPMTGSAAPDATDTDVDEFFRR